MQLGILMDLERVPDDRIVPFLVDVLVDRRQPTEVRTHLLKRIRNGGIRPADNGPVAAALISLLGESANANVRTHTVLALGALTDVDGVLPVLGSIALDESAPLDLRYTAFTCLERAGPTEDSIAVLRTLAHDETLGRTAHSTLLAVTRGFSRRRIATIKRAVSLPRVSPRRLADTWPKRSSSARSRREQAAIWNAQRRWRVAW
jgi:hypothetical protein